MWIQPLKCIIVAEPAWCTTWVTSRRGLSSLTVLFNHGWRFLYDSEAWGMGTWSLLLAGQVVGKFMFNHSSLLASFLQNWETWDSFTLTFPRGALLSYFPWFSFPPSLARGTPTESSHNPQTYELERRHWIYRDLHDFSRLKKRKSLSAVLPSTLSPTVRKAIITY